MFSLFVIYIVILAALFGGLCYVTGEGQKGSQILINCLTAMILYLVIIQLFQTGGAQEGVISDSLPIVNHVYQAGSIGKLLSGHPFIFAMDFVELTIVIILYQWIANLISFPNAGFAGKVTSRIVIAGISIVLYGCFMGVVRDNILIKWCVYCVECIITGTSILYPPAMVLSYISGLKKDNYAISYLISVFPKTSLGKSISSSLACAVIFVAFAMSLENQYGSVCNVVKGGVSLLESGGGLIVLLMGLYTVVRVLKPRRSAE